jgi:hypothetical protein
MVFIDVWHVTGLIPGRQAPANTLKVMLASSKPVSEDLGDDLLLLSSSFLDYSDAI